MSKLKLLASLPALLLTACATTDGPEIKIVDTACQWTKPIYVSRGDVLSDRTAEQILAHNETGKRKCGWKPAKPKKQ